MTNKQILKKAILKAEKNGYIYENSQCLVCGEMTGKDIFDIIFSHDFAKAFWNTGHCEDFTTSTCMGIERVYGWKTHLQVMVLKEEPLKYLKKFL